jgi:hypothetical protein
MVAVGPARSEHAAESSPPTQIQYKLEFIEPFSAVAQTTFQIAPEGDTAARVRWAMEGSNNFMSKVFGIFMDMDAAIGADFEKGLANLKAQSEAEAKRIAQAAAAAQAARLKTAAEAEALQGQAATKTPADPSPASIATPP